MDKIQPRVRAVLAILTCPFIALMGFIPACGGGNTTPPVQEVRSDKVRAADPVVSGDDAARLAADNLAFATDMHARLRTLNPDNFVFSPTSISVAFAMLYGGAATTTAAQMASAMHFSLPPDRLHPAFNALDLALATPPPGSDADAFRLSIANSTWTQDGFSFLPSYLDLLAENYGAGMFVEDFAANPERARAHVNGWVASKTEQMIPELFPRGTINPATALVLANAVYFHGDWATPFRSPSADGTFHALRGDVSVPVTVPMMSGKFNAGLWSGAGWSAAGLDYVGGTTSMIVVVPDTGTFQAFEEALTADGLTAILAPGSHGSGDLTLPRFKFETGVTLGDVLAAMGMPEVFTPAADLSGIDGARDLSVQAAIHRAVIAVDEKGTTAAAATDISVGVTSVSIQLVIDRPFLFFIRHAPTGAILFQGRVVDPSQ